MLVVREEELALLENLLYQKSSSFMVVYGAKKSAQICQLNGVVILKKDVSL